MNFLLKFPARYGNHPEKMASITRLSVLGGRYQGRKIRHGIKQTGDQQQGPFDSSYTRIDNSSPYLFKTHKVDYTILNPNN
jgi:hypothetical protein